MMIRPIRALPSAICYHGKNSKRTGNPVNRSLEQKLAILNAGGVSAVAGALTTAIARSYTASWKHAGMFGVGAFFITMLFVCPRFLYKSGISSYTKEKELDVFSKEKEVQKKLLTDVNDAIDNNKDDLVSKLDNYSKTIAPKNH